MDYHSLFFTHDPVGLTQLGWALKSYDLSFAQGQRQSRTRPPYCQGRLPAFFASEHITDIAAANPDIDAVRTQGNEQEIHRELRRTPQRAGEQAWKKNAPPCGPRRAARGGIACGACAPPSTSAAMVACPSARNA